MTLHLTPSYFPQKGGIETHLLELNRELVSRGEDVVVITQQRGEELFEETIEGVKVIRIPSSHTNNKLKTWFWMWRRLFLFNKVTRIHIHDVFWWIAPMVPLITTPYFITHHGWEGNFPVRWQAKLQRWIASKLSKGSLHVGAFIQEFYWDVPTKVTYGAVPSKLQQPKTNKTTTSKTKKNFNITFVGRLVPENSINHYSTLFTHLKKNLQKKSPSTKITITWVGDGPLRDICEKTGKVTGMLADPLPELEKADIVFASSYLAVLESQALGKLVVALYDHQLKQRYLETYPCAQHMIISQEPKDAADQLTQLIKKNQLSHYSSQAQSCATRHTWKKVADTYQDLWSATK